MTAIAERTKTYVAVLTRVHDVDPALGSAIRRAVYLSLIHISEPTRRS